MNIPGFDYCKRRLPILLACVVLLQSLPGMPGLAADETGDTTIGGPDAHQSSALGLDSHAVEIAETAVDEECREPCDLAQCDCVLCCQGNQQSILLDLVPAGVLPASCWSMTCLQQPSSRIHSTINRPPIA